MGVIILSAPKGYGKTTYLRAWMARIAERGRSVGGLAAPAVLENGHRVGYDLLDLRTGEQWPLARLGTAADPTLGVGAFRLSSSALRAGNDALRAAILDRLSVIAIDEVGPLEFGGGGWASGLELALSEKVSGQDLILVVRPGLVDELAGRFPSPLWAGARRVEPPWPSSLLL